jgi:hypothetical protein
MAGETAQQKNTLVQAENTNVLGDHDWPRDLFGNPMVKIQCAATELVPTMQYGNVTVGPVMVSRFVIAVNADQIKEAIRETQSIVEEAVSEDRKSVHDLTRARSVSN